MQASCNSLQNPTSFGSRSTIAYYSKRESNLKMYKPIGFIIDDRLSVLIHVANMCELSVDVIVNAANGKLRHRGGLSKAIASAAGEELITEDLEILEKYGRDLEPGEVALSKAGNLPCKAVLHAVGPHWPSVLKVGPMKITAPHTSVEIDKEQECIEILTKAYTSALVESNTNSFIHIALPLLSSGSFGVPAKVVAGALYDAIMSFVKDSTSLREIHIINVEGSSLDEVCHQFKHRSSSSTVRDMDNIDVTTSISRVVNVNDRLKATSSDHSPGDENTSDIRPNISGESKDH